MRVKLVSLFILKRGTSTLARGVESFRGWLGGAGPSLLSWIEGVILYVSGWKDRCGRELLHCTAKHHDDNLIDAHDGSYTAT